MHPMEKFVNFNRCFKLRLQHADKTLKVDALKKTKHVKDVNKHPKIKKKPQVNQAIVTSKETVKSTPIAESLKQETITENTYVQASNLPQPVVLLDDISFPNLCKNESLTYENFTEGTTYTLKENVGDTNIRSEGCQRKNSTHLVPNNKHINDNNDIRNNKATYDQERTKKPVKVVSRRKSRRSSNKNISINITCNVQLPQQIYHKQTEMVSAEVQTDSTHIGNVSSKPLVIDFNNSIEEWNMERFIKPTYVDDEFDDILGFEKNKNYHYRIENLENSIKNKLKRF